MGLRCTASIEFCFAHTNITKILALKVYLGAPHCLNRPETFGNHILESILNKIYERGNYVYLWYLVGIVHEASVT